MQRFLVSKKVKTFFSFHRFIHVRERALIYYLLISYSSASLPSFSPLLFFMLIFPRSPVEILPYSYLKLYCMFSYPVSVCVCNAVHRWCWLCKRDMKYYTSVFCGRPFTLAWQKCTFCQSRKTPLYRNQYDGCVEQEAMKDYVTTEIKTNPQLVLLTVD